MIVDAYLMRGFHKEFADAAYSLCCGGGKKEEHGDTDVDALLSEDAKVARLRRELRENAAALEVAEDVLQEIV